MKTEKVKEYLQRYLDNVVFDIPEEIKFTVYDVLKGTYNPPIIHVFIDTDPKIETNTWDTPNRIDRQVDKQIHNFFQILSIPNKIKIHWNKRPFLRKGKKYDKEI